MKIFLYTYLSKYSKSEELIEETYRVRAESRDEAEFLLVNGCADLITTHNKDLGRVESMTLKEFSEI